MAEALYKRYRTGIIVMKWLNRLIGGLLAVSLMVTAVSWVSNETVWNSNYVLKTASEHGFYDGVAKALSSMLIGPNATGDQRYLLSQLITPSLVREHLAGAIAGLESYYREGGVPPHLDLSDVKRQFDALRLAPPPLVASLIDAPVTLSNPAVDTVSQVASQKTAQLLWLAPVAAAVLVVIIVVIARRSRWMVLSGAAVGAAILTVLAAGISVLMPSIGTTSLTTSVWGALAPPVKSLGEIIAHDVSQRLLWWAVGFGIAAVLFSLIGLAAGASRKLRRSPDKTSAAE
jgi:hypothetical protein